MLPFIIILIIVIVLFLPLPIKLTINFDKENYYINIYKKKINLKANKISKTKKESNKKIRYKFNYFTKDIVIEIIKKINNLKLKPYSKFKLNITIGFNDAHYTAICYGILYSFYSVFYEILSIFFNINKYNYTVVPDFDDGTFRFDIESIILINLANVISIVFIILIILLKKNKKEFYKKGG